MYICRNVSLLMFFFVSLIILSSGSVANAQSDAPRQTVAITYPLDQTVNVRFRGTTRFPRLKGEAKIRRSGRRGTSVELSIENMPRALELGGVYTTFVAWAISPEGRVDNIGEIKRSGSIIVDTKFAGTTPLQTFAIIVTAEPHFMVRYPSREVILENLPPLPGTDAQVRSSTINYLGNSSAYFRDPQVAGIGPDDYLRTPVSLFDARQAINLAKYAGAGRDASEELEEAQGQLNQAEQAWRLKQPDAEIDVLARRAISSGVKTEEVAEARKAARLQREEAQRRDRALRDAENTAADAGREVENLRTELQNEQHARELAERDAVNAQQSLADMRVENARLRDELQNVRAESEDAKLKLARIEGERAAEQNRLAAEQKAVQLRAAAGVLRQSLAAYGTVRDSDRGIVLTLSESIWTAPRVSSFAAAGSSKIDALAALLANNPDYQLLIESHTDNQGDAATLQTLTQERAQAIADRLISGGVDAGRVQAAGIGGTSPIASNAKPATRIKNRRTEITLLLNVTSVGNGQ
jgi:outer membrane protein OmpA-like peptidoglycan-associated protein